MKSSELFVKCLESEGMEYVFGLPNSADDLSGIKLLLCILNDMP